MLEQRITLWCYQKSAEVILGRIRSRGKKTGSIHEYRRTEWL